MNQSKQYPAWLTRSLPAACIGLLLVVVITLVSGVFPGFAQAKIPVTLMLAAQELPSWKPVIAEFERQNPDISVQTIEGPSATNLVEDLYTSAFLLGDSPYDLVYMDIVWVPKFAAAGWLMPLNDQIPSAELKDFLKADLAEEPITARSIDSPARSDAGMLYYRKDLLDEAGLKPPHTVPELLAAA
ncbi:MAG: extracellular solute-binding protein, partial [Alkalinema sp. RL_2_19]|nr:extracellular solute-binding protein [Alkalinema sp. RL_2_19]